MKKSLIVLICFFIVAGAYVLPGDVAAQDPFIGEIRLFAGNFAPRGWALCDGQLLPIPQYTALFAILGTTYGGDGRTTFALPDLRGRAPIHAGQGPGLLNRRLGQRGGREDVALAVEELPPHSHQAVGSTNPTSATTPAGKVWGSTGRTRLYAAPGAPANLSPAAIANTGAGMSHENMPPYLVINYIIALQGLFPPRN
ncbi:MAG: phage tail protein [Deltaproteobacteria bacterium]|jgi:microcystin-dependent protein|nr:phage tail protein [Deltaproteobacteria bacterium]